MFYLKLGIKYLYNICVYYAKKFHSYLIISKDFFAIYLNIIYTDNNKYNKKRKKILIKVLTSVAVKLERGFDVFLGS